MQKIGSIKDGPETYILYHYTFTLFFGNKDKKKSKSEVNLIFGNNKAMKKAILTVLGLLSTALASENGGYYTCDAPTLAAKNQCIFALTGSQPEDWIKNPCSTILTELLEMISTEEFNATMER